jgi:NADH:ubiquinone oxidoreductase subunit
VNRPSMLRIDVPPAFMLEPALGFIGDLMAKKTKRVRRDWTKAEERELKAHSKAKTPVAKIAKQTKRTESALRQKAITLGIPLGHRR